MASYTQDYRSVSNTYIQYFLSQFRDQEYLIFADDDYYYCVTSKEDFTNTGNKWSVSNATVYKILRNSSLGTTGSVSVTNENQTSVTVYYPYYIYSNIGVGTVVVSPVDTMDSYNASRFVPPLLFGVLIFLIISTFIQRRWRIRD